MTESNTLATPSIEDPLVAAAPPVAPAKQTSDIPTEAIDIESFIEQSRLDMGATVDELVDRLHPKNQAKAVKVKAQGLLDTAKDTVVQAKEGDAGAQKKLGIAAGAVFGLVLLKVLRRRK